MVTVWLVFHDPVIDYRVVIVGALLPDVLDAPFGGARVLHTLVAAVVVLAVVMVGTRGRRAARRRWLFLPVGMLLHLVFDGIWARADAFWWPFSGKGLGGPLPALDHGIAVLVAEELAGLAALAWCWWRFRLHDAEIRGTFLRTGRLPRDLVA